MLPKKASYGTRPAVSCFFFSVTSLMKSLNSQLQFELFSFCYMSQLVNEVDEAPLLP